MLSQQNIPEVDVLLIGAGFGAFTTLNKLRKQGLNVRIWEKGAASGGIWYWNQYPGARVDSDTPIYQLFDEELYQNFTFTERYAGWKELKRYFEFVENKWNIKPHVDYNHNLEHAQFDEKRRQWLCEASNGDRVYCTWFIPAIGFAAKKYTPPIPGLSDFKGDVYHTATWPQWGVNLRKKKIAVIGTGASGIQTIQETAPDAEHLTVYQRTPNYCLPMNQSNLIPEVEERKKNQGEYKKQFDTTWTTFAGFQYDFSEKNTFDDTPEEREAFFQKLFNEEGGFRFWLKTYKDMLFDQKANDEAYNFWRKEVHKRVPDKEKAELLAPAVKPHPWGTKRPSLEQNFYEVVSLPHVDIKDINKDPITKVSENSITTQSGDEVQVDTIILATGFDAVTGSLGQLDIRGTDGRTIKDHWADGLKSSMGIALNKFPNMFFLYGPQAPTAFSNGPTCTQAQAIWLDKTIAQLTKDRITRIEAKEEAEKDWTRQCHEVWDISLFPQAKSWYSGANIPGKKVEPLNWAGGMPRYIKSLDESLENDYQGWVVAS